MTSAMLITMVLGFALSVSVAVSIGLASIVGIQVTNANMLISAKEIFNSINKFPLAAVPFFILAGNLMETGGISRRLVEFAKSIVGGVQGGLPMTCGTRGVEGRDREYCGRSSGPQQSSSSIRSSRARMSMPSFVRGPSEAVLSLPDRYVRARLLGRLVLLLALLSASEIVAGGARDVQKR